MYLLKVPMFPKFLLTLHFFYTIYSANAFCVRKILAEFYWTKTPFTGIFVIRCLASIHNFNYGRIFFDIPPIDVNARMSTQNFRWILIRAKFVQGYCNLSCYYWIIYFLRLRYYGLKGEFYTCFVSSMLFTLYN